MKNQFALIAVAALSVFVLNGCGKLDFSETVLHPVTSLLSTAQGVEVVSGASTGTKTLINGYTVDASVGSVRDKLETTTPNGYTVYNGVKGSIVSQPSQ